MVQFPPFAIDGIPMKEQFMNWNELVQPPFNKETPSMPIRARACSLMNGIENTSMLVSHQPGAHDRQ